MAIACGFQRPEESKPGTRAAEVLGASAQTGAKTELIRAKPLLGYDGESVCVRQEDQSKF